MIKKKEKNIFLIFVENNSYEGKQSYNWKIARV